MEEGRKEGMEEEKKKDGLRFRLAAACFPPSPMLAGRA